MNVPSRRGFTLIELLTVIAIISILAALTATVLPRVLERAKISTTVNNFSQVRTALTTYYSDHGTYPPAYGYINFDSRDKVLAGTVTPDDRFHQPYLAFMGFFRNFDIYDNWAENYDTNRDGRLELFEFQPVLESEFPANKPFPPLYDGFGGVTGRRDTEKRPFVYVPVNLRRLQRVRNYYAGVAQNIDLFQGMYARVWDPTDPVNGRFISNILGPASRYDAFVLISPGPQGDTGGILSDMADPSAGLDTENPANKFIPLDFAGAYHIMALRIFYLATRDANDNGALDFDFRTRTKADEASPGAYPQDGNLRLLPDGTALAGPMIFVQER